MAICKYCDQEMRDSRACTWNTTVSFPDGKELPSVPYSGPGPCHDCGIANEGHHHPGCDMERCPRCFGQLISCGCLDEGE